MTEHELISVIVPSFNLAEFLPHTLNSILEQSHRPLEIVVVDGGSTDATVDVLRDFAEIYPEVRWLSEPDDGPADAVNKGLKLARGSIGAIQSADDIYYSDVLELVMETFRAHPGHGMVYGHTAGIDWENRVVGGSRFPAFSWESFFGISICLPQSSVFFRMEIAREIGGWNPSYFAADLDFWLRMSLRTRPLLIDEVLSGWRVRPEQRTTVQNSQAIWDGYWRMIDESDELRRAPRRVRRLARASRHLLALQFHPTGDLWSVRWHALRGLLGHPTFWRYHPAHRMARLVPGWPTSKRLVRRIRKRISS